MGIRTHASLWTGSAGSWVDLHPAGSTDSRANSTSGTQQVGYAFIGGSPHASLWSGTAASWIDLNPAGASNSVANDVLGSFQVGYAVFTGQVRAGIWSGTSGSWIDLSSFVPGSWRQTIAQSIATDGVTLYVAGSGINNSTNRTEALLWTRPLSTAETVSPSSFATVRGRLDSGDVTSLGTDDNNYLRHCKFIVPNQTVPPIEVQVNGTTTRSSTTGITVSLTGAMSVNGVFTQSIEQWNWVTGVYEDMATAGATTLESTVSSQSTGVHNMKIGVGGALRARYFVRQTGPSASPLYCYNADLVKWVVN